MGETPTPADNRHVDRFPWSDNYKVGVRIIDMDHKMLFEIINTLHAGIVRGLAGDSLNVALAGLIRYVDEHFEREENLMRQYQFPDFESHHEKHRELVRTVHAIRKVQVSDPASIDLSKLMDFLGNWLKHHVMRADRAYVPYLRGEATGTLAVDRDAAGDGAAEPTGTEEEEELVSVTVQVPPDCVDVVRRCAQTLRRGGEDARAIADMTDPIAHMSLDEAKQVCLAVLN